MPTSLGSNKTLQGFLGIFIILAAGLVGWRLYVLLEPKIRINFYDIPSFTKDLYKLETQNATYYVSTDMQAELNSTDRRDLSTRPLFSLFPPHYGFETDNSSTVYLMKRLFDNYEVHWYVEENVTAAEEKEESDFLNAILKTPIMNKTMEYLHSKDHVAADKAAHYQLLKDIWFTQYSRGGGQVVGSSGFESVFLAELRSGEVVGLRNWVYFREQERQGLLNYQGYRKHLRLNTTRDHYVLEVSLVYRDIQMPHNTLFVGTSPELEMSLYTLCFVMSKDRHCQVQLGLAKLNIMTHSVEWKGKSMIAAAYPSFIHKVTKTIKKKPKTLVGKILQNVGKRWNKKKKKKHSRLF